MHNYCCFSNYKLRATGFELHIVNRVLQIIFGVYADIIFSVQGGKNEIFFVSFT
jgi:hypothetical protein